MLPKKPDTNHRHAYFTSFLCIFQPFLQRHHDLRAVGEHCLEVYFAPATTHSPIHARSFGFPAPFKRKKRLPFPVAAVCAGPLCQLLCFFFLLTTVVPITALPLMNSNAIRSIRSLFSPVLGESVLSRTGLSGALSPRLTHLRKEQGHRRCGVPVLGGEREMLNSRRPEFFSCTTANRFRPHGVVLFVEGKK